MAAPKKVKLGCVFKKINEKTGKPSFFAALGQKNPKAPKYDYRVEIAIYDNDNKLIARQTNGFIELSDPRTKAEELLAASIISEEQAEMMQERAQNLPESLRFEMFVKRS